MLHLDLVAVSPLAYKTENTERADGKLPSDRVKGN
jgi:hypothetical protein